MKKAAIDILCCPLCKTSLSLEIDKEKNDEIIQGILKCTKCKNSYIIKDSIADLRPPKKN